MSERALTHGQTHVRATTTVRNPLLMIRKHTRTHELVVIVAVATVVVNTLHELKI